MSKNSKRAIINWAQFRFSVIGGLLARPAKSGQLQKELGVLADREYLHPTTGEWVKFGTSTIERWYYQALKTQNPVDALARKIRSDAGQPIAMSQKLLAILQKQYENYPNWSYQLHADNLAAIIKQQPELGEFPSYSTILRRMKEKGWYKKGGSHRPQTPGQKEARERLEKREVRSYESEYVHALWHLDFHSGRRVVDVNGQWHTPRALCILDDRSRLCCHIQWYLTETAQDLIHGLSQAFCKRGLPRSLMSDNGSAMIAHETENGLLNLGIIHEKTLPYSPYQNGKQESFWSQLEGRLLAMLSRVEPLTLEFLNRSSQAWVELEYNRSLHHEIVTSPLDRMLKGPNVSRPSPDSQSLRFAFTVQERRAQRRSDGTVQIKGVRFEVPSAFRHFQELFVRYQPFDFRIAYLVDNRTGSLLAQIRPQDKTKNATGLRRTLKPEDQVPPAQELIPIPKINATFFVRFQVSGFGCQVLAVISARSET